MLVVIGRIARAHGIRGQVLVEVRTDEPDERFRTAASLRAGSRTLTVASARPHGDRLLVTFDEVADRTAAEELHGVLLECDIDPLAVPDADDEFYDHQLVGLTARDRSGREVGTVTAVLHLPAQDTVVIDAGGREVLVPFVSELVPHVDVPGGSLVVADLPGLVDADEPDSGGDD